VGTVGGGTGLPSFRACLELMGCQGGGKANRLAEIIAAVAIAGETSTVAAIIAGEFVGAHERLGRNRPDPSA
jgi:hydroxymethylglutaryl-CoA reductase (NADPH)